MSEVPAAKDDHDDENQPVHQSGWVTRLLNPWIMLTLLIVAVLLCAPFVYRQMQLAGLPDIKEPFDVEAFFNRDVKPINNALSDYKRATSLFVRPSTEIENELIKLNQVGWDYPSAVLLEWLDNNQPALQEWKRGTRKPVYAEFDMRNLNYATLLSNTQEMRNFARMAIGQGMRLQKAGQHEEAIELYLAAYRSGHQIQTRGCLIQYLVGYAIQSMVAPNMMAWSQEKNVSPDQIQQIRETIQKLRRNNASLSDAMKSEYVALRNTMNTTDPKDLVSMTGIPLPGAGSSYASLLAHTYLFLQNEPNVSIRGIKHWQANLLRHIDKPMYDRPAQTPYGLFEEPAGFERPQQHLSAQQIEAVANRAYLLRSLLPAFTQVALAHERSLMQQQLLDVTLALEMYRKKQGQYPTSLKALPRELLTKSPQDLFDTKGATIKYKRDSNQQVTIYSIGENKSDDGGDVLQTAGRPPDLGYQLDPVRLKPVVAPKPKS